MSEAADRLLLAPTDMVKCDKFNCRLQAGACAQRQHWEGRKTGKGVPANQGGVNGIHFAYCRSGNCLQGLDYKARLDPAAVVRPVAIMPGPATAQTMKANTPAGPKRTAPFKIRPLSETKEPKMSETLPRQQPRSQPCDQTGCIRIVRPKNGVLTPTCFKCRVKLGVTDPDIARKRRREQLPVPKVLQQVHEAGELKKELVKQASRPSKPKPRPKPAGAKLVDVTGYTNDQLVALLEDVKGEAQRRIEEANDLRLALGAK